MKKILIFPILLGGLCSPYQANADTITLEDVLNNINFQGLCKASGGSQELGKDVSEKVDALITNTNKNILELRLFLQKNKNNEAAMDLNKKLLTVYNQLTVINIPYLFFQGCSVNEKSSQHK
ncbi:hypothetical protein Bealeia1_01771 [Candidatus Bealeia paramacronuclearis]|uniref:Uncharacterized protein n=1 Tax=Candidatus Bealeia paramacronuclearis TaxID=1921001 RepID=A0ABZ2C7T9_9PROT|nr:hypothetical protein [Candidatus Bealeia paramacronuclearis]